MPPASPCGALLKVCRPILKLVGITAPLQVAGINGGLAIWNGLSTLGLAQCVERIGRRPMWITGMCGVFVSFACITGLSVRESDVSRSPSALTTQGGFAQTKIASVGIAVIPFLYFFNGFYNMAWSCLGNLCMWHLLSSLTPITDYHRCD